MAVQLEIIIFSAPDLPIFQYHICLHPLPCVLFVFTSGLLFCLDANMEADVAKGRRDWAFSERDKVVLERESIRTLCDKLRRERDR